MNDFLFKIRVFAEFWNIISKKDYFLGETSRRFEKELADYLGVKHALGVASGSDALILALKACGIGSGDEVIVPALGIFSTAAAVSWVGAKPVFVDVEDHNLGISAESVEKEINKKTRAVIVSHLAGRMVNIEKLSKFAKRKSLYLIEDSARAIGVKFKGHHIGFYSDLSCLSFNPVKILGGFGDGGAVVTNDDNLAEKVNLMRSYGTASHKEFNLKHPIVGTASRISSFQAAVLFLKLENTDEVVEQRRGNYYLYLNMLKGVGDFLLSEVSSDDFINGYEFCVLTQKRDELYAHLRKNGVKARIQFYLPLPYLEAFRDLGYKEGDFPNAEKISKDILILPTHGKLSENEIRRICDLVINFFK